MNKKWIQMVSVSTVIAATAYLLVALWAGRTEVLAALSVVSTQTLFTVLSLSLVNYGLRFLRWHYYLRKLGSSIPILHDLRIYIGGFALTTTPGKAGELARGLWLSPYGVPLRLSAAAFFAERLQDFIAILLLCCMGLSLFPNGRWMMMVGAGIVVAALIVLFMPTLAATTILWTRTPRGRIAGLFNRIAQILKLTRDCLKPAPLLLGLCLGIAAWFAECWSFSILLRALGYPIPITTACSIYALSMLAGAISFMPGGLGGSEAMMIILLRVCGVPTGVAVSATLLIRAATLWFAVLLGVIALSIRVRIPDQRPIAVRSTLVADGPE